MCSESLEKTEGPTNVPSQPLIEVPADDDMQAGLDVLDGEQTQSAQRPFVSNESAEAVSLRGRPPKTGKGKR